MLDWIGLVGFGCVIEHSIRPTVESIVAGARGRYIPIGVVPGEQGEPQNDNSQRWQI